MNRHATQLGLIALYCSIAAPAFAYLDGATGSMLLQALIGGVATAMVFGRTYLAKIKSLVWRGPKAAKSGKAE